MHIFSEFDRSLDDLAAHTHDLAGKIFNEFHKLRQIAKGSRPLAQSPLPELPALLALCRDVEFEAAIVLTRFHPLASDLRLVIALWRILDKLKAIIRQTSEIALLLRDIPLPQPLSGGNTTSLDSLFALAEDLLSKSLASFENRAPEAAELVRSQDKLLDIAHHDFMDFEISSYVANPLLQTPVELLFIARSIERVGDHAKNIAAQVVFLSENRDITHTSSR